MLETIFGFRGRLNRLQFFLGGLALGAAFAIAAALVFALIMPHRGQGGAGLKPALSLFGLFALVAVPPYLWISFSLQARRIRDIGWNPLYVIPAWMALAIVDPLFLRIVPVLSVVGSLICLALAGCLLFWPGDGGASSAPWAEPPGPKKSGKSASSAPAPAASNAAWNVAPARTEFGRRGL